MLAKVDKTPIEVTTFEFPGLGNRSYLLHDTKVAVVVDAQRDPIPYLELAERLGLEITHVFDTHLHNDYVSGGLGLARECGASYVIARDEAVDFEKECTRLDGGDELTTGSMTIEAVSTPGHTPNHLSYLARQEGRGASFLCSGGSLLLGSTGRTDLFGPDRSGHLANAQWHSVRQLIETLPGETVLLPTHGFGSFCAVSSDEVIDLGLSTLENERSRNPAMKLDLEEFIELLTVDPQPIPAYYEHMAPLNRAGQGAPIIGPIRIATPQDVTRSLANGSWVIDVRQRRSFALRHRTRSVNFELGPQFVTYFGWIVPFECPFVLVGENSQDIEEARRSLSRIGREHAAATSCVDSLLEGESPQVGSYRVTDFVDLAQRIDQGEQPTILDVRHQGEWRRGHLTNARHVPLPDLNAAIADLDASDPVWVHCEAGYRAAIAASMLARDGFTPVLVDDLFAHAFDVGLSVEQGP